MNEDKVLNFMNSIDQQNSSMKADQAFKQSLDYKYRVLNQEKDKARAECLSRIFEKFYRSAVPLNDEYKCAYNSELNNDMPDFAKSRGAEDLAYYVGEAKKRGSKAATRIMESVNQIVNAYFEDVEMNINKVDDPEKMVFKMDDATEERIDAVSRDMEMDDLASVIHDNVKATALSEISRAKAEKEASKKVEEELANDMNVTSESAIDFALQLRGYTDKKIFQPSLFEGIMLGKLSRNAMLCESGLQTPVYLYNTLDMYGFTATESASDDVHYATPEELSFVESVREYTCLSIAKALGLENFNNLSMIREMAQKYAAG